MEKILDTPFIPATVLHPPSSNPNFSLSAYHVVATQHIRVVSEANANDSITSVRVLD